MQNPLYTATTGLSIHPYTYCVITVKWPDRPIKYAQYEKTKTNLFKPIRDYIRPTGRQPRGTRSTDGGRRTREREREREDQIKYLDSINLISDLYRGVTRH